jgi:hypothetical protein
MKVIQVLKKKKYGLIALVGTILMLIVYPFLQVLLNGGFHNYFFWFELILKEAPLNFVLYIIFSGLFGVVTSLNIYNWKHRTCDIKGSAGTGGIGTILAIFTSQCSACFSLATVFLPTVAVGALVVYNTLFNLISVGLMVVAIHLLGGFKK